MADSPNDKLVEAVANAPILGPGYNFASVTDKISAIVLRRRTPTWWIVGFLISFALVCLLMVSLTLHRLAWAWASAGITIPHRMGICDHQFRLVDWYWRTLEP